MDVPDFHHVEMEIVSYADKSVIMRNVFCNDITAPLSKISIQNLIFDTSADSNKIRMILTSQTNRHKLQTLKVEGIKCYFDYRREAWKFDR